jgi:hypothetical protein
VRKAEKDQRSVLMQQMETVLQQLNRPHTIPAVEEEREVAQATRLAFQEYLKDTDSVKSNYEKTRYPGGTVFEYQAARLEVGEKYPQEVVAEALGLEEEDMEQDSWSIDELFEILKAQRVREKAQRAREEALVSVYAQPKVNSADVNLENPNPRKGHPDPRERRPNPSAANRS